MNPLSPEASERPMPRQTLSLGMILLAACSSAVDSAGDADGSTSSSETTAPASTDPTGPVTTATASTSGPTTDPVTSADDTTGDASTDTSESETSADGSSTGVSAPCAMDLLFVVDNSASMEVRQPLFLAALPELVEGLDGVDVRAMVVDVDGDPLVACEPACDSECYVDGVCDPFDVNCSVVCALCPSVDCDAPPPPLCDVTLGAGLVVEQGADNAPCDFASGERWIDSSEPSFATALSCAANVGIASTAPEELIMESVTTAVDNMGDASDCNAGFLRPEAGLGVFVVTDEADEASAGNVDFWRLELEASQRDPDRIAFGAIIGDLGLPGALCVDGGDFPGVDAPGIRAFADMLGDRGVVGSICAQTYAPTLAEFAEVVAGMCD